MKLYKKGEPILNGAMEVDNPKIINGEEVMCIRPISILTPLNLHSRNVDGDNGYLPHAAFLVNMLLDDAEEISIEGKDMQSCSNPFFLFACWKQHNCFCYDGQRQSIWTAVR